MQDLHLSKRHWGLFFCPALCPRMELEPDASFRGQSDGRARFVLEARRVVLGVQADSVFLEQPDQEENCLLYRKPLSHAAAAPGVPQEWLQCASYVVLTRSHKRCS